MSGKALKTRPRRERGFTLLETVIAVGIVGIIIAVVVTFLVNGKNQVLALKSMGVLEDYKNVLRARIDCEKSLSELTSRCDGATFSQSRTVTLSDNTGAKLLDRVSVNNIVDRSWEVRAICAEDNPYYSIKIQRRYVGKNPKMAGAKSWKDDMGSVPIVCQKESGWLAAWGQNCPTFCNSKGLANVRSPDAYILNFGGVNYPTTGSFCTSGELIPPSAQADWHAGKFPYVSGCWWGPCPNGSDSREGASVGGRCYGVFKGGEPQKRDNDPTDTTAACYCE